MLWIVKMLFVSLLFGPLEMALLLLSLQRMEISVAEKKALSSQKTKKIQLYFYSVNQYFMTRNDCISEVDVDN